MTKERIIPECMMPESEPTVAGTGSVSEDGTVKTQVTSRVANLKEGYCPLCDTSMRVSTANGIPVHVCPEHSLVMPMRDQELLNVQ